MKMKKLTACALTAAMLLTSAASVYASAAEKTVRGDLTGDGDVTVSDATTVQKICADFIKADDKTRALADVNNNGAVDIDDATTIQKYAACYGVELPEYQSYTDEELKEAGSGAEAGFAVKLLQNTIENGENTLISPLSVMYALGMTANGSCRNTRTQIEKTLGLTVDNLNRYLSSYPTEAEYRYWDYDTYEPKMKKETLNIANGIWCNSEISGMSISDSFTKAAKDWYNAEAKSVPFDQKTLDEINDWVNTRTNNTIPRIIDQIDSKAFMYLINALAFEAEWEDPFNFDYGVRENSFTNSDGSVSTVNYLVDTSDDMNYISDENAQGFIRRYKSGRFAFAALLPDRGIKAEDYVNSLSGEKLREMLKKAVNNENGRYLIDIMLPKFKTEYSLSLKGALNAMGMPDSFNKDISDFSLMLTPGSESNLFISDVIHKTYIELTEKGTKAGAATAVVMEPGAAPADPLEPKEIHLTRPFVYMLIDTKTCTPFFIGVQNKMESL